MSKPFYDATSWEAWNEVWDIHPPESERLQQEAARIASLPLPLRRLAEQHQRDQFEAEPSEIEKQARALRASSLRVS